MPAAILALSEISSHGLSAAPNRVTGVLGPDKVRGIQQDVGNGGWIMRIIAGNELCVGSLDTRLHFTVRRDDSRGHGRGAEISAP